MIVNDTAESGKVCRKEISEGIATYDPDKPQDLSNKGTAQVKVKLLFCHIIVYRATIISIQNDQHQKLKILESNLLNMCIAIAT